ncbi:molybdopterin-dependent oxidoreductase [Panacagrimonas sp.]|uniref:molybdopterin-dependent oxidoreductase n=1 Tax=Panacagrimonas sp. TaxID=2480088 RepID=UPI003B5232F3
MPCAVVEEGQAQSENRDSNVDPLAPAHAALPEVEIRGDVAHPLRLQAEHLHSVPRIQQRSDFHCVTTRSVRAVQWSGWRFAQVYEDILRPQAGAERVAFRGADGYACCLPLEDLLASDVLLAD